MQSYVVFKEKFNGKLAEFKSVHYLCARLRTATAVRRKEVWVSG